jgi:hypothetical protein
VGALGEMYNAKEGNPNDGYFDEVRAGGPGI